MSANSSDGLIGMGGEFKVLCRLLVVGGVADYQKERSSPHRSGRRKGEWYTHAHDNSTNENDKATQHDRKAKQ